MRNVLLDMEEGSRDVCSVYAIFSEGNNSSHSNSIQQKKTKKSRFGLFRRSKSVPKVRFVYIHVDFMFPGLHSNIKVIGSHL